MSDGVVCMAFGRNARREAAALAENLAGFGYPLTIDGLRATSAAALPPRKPETIQDLLLSGSMRGYVWTINGTTYKLLAST